MRNLLVAIDRDATVRSNTKDLPRLLDDAVRDIVERQRAVGIDIVGDGETSKFGYSTYVRERLTGLDGPPAPLALADLADFPEFASTIKLEITTASCVGPVTFRGAEAVETDIRRLKRALADYGRRDRVHDRGIAGDYLAVPRQQSLFQSGSLPLRVGRRDEGRIRHDRRGRRHPPA